MPNPRQFWYQYGSIVSHHDTIAAGQRLAIPQNLDRYLLVFWATSVDIVIEPADADAPGLAGWLFASADDPFIITHALHGALCQLGWIGVAPFGAVTVRWLEGFMIGGENSLEAIASRPPKQSRPIVSVTGQVPEALITGSVLDTPPAPQPAERDFPPGWVAWFLDPVDENAHHRAAVNGFGIRFDPVWGRYYLITLADLLRLFPNG